MSLTELQEKMLQRIQQDEFPCTYPPWLEARMKLHRQHIDSMEEGQITGKEIRTKPMKRLIHEQQYAAGWSWDR